jgi:hypothetical protein
MMAVSAVPVLSLLAACSGGGAAASRETPTVTSYIREGIYTSTATCSPAAPAAADSRARQVQADVGIAPGGALIHQVAIGFLHEEHISLAADRTGHWLLYLADHDLWVSRDGRIPSQLATGLIAASWM